jgi:hypothetical protein
MFACGIAGIGEAFLRMGISSNLGIFQFLFFTYEHKYSGFNFCSAV